MKLKYWLKILIFVVVIAVLTVGAAIFLHVPEARDVTGMYGFYLEEENSLDVVLIGPSPVYTGFYSPLAYEQEEFTSYAVSTGGLSGAMYPSAVRETLQTQNPQLFVVDLSGFCDEDQKDSAAVRRWIDSIRNGENREKSIADLVSEEDKDSYRTAFIKYHSNWTRIRGCFKTLIDKGDQKKRGYSVTKNFCAYTDTSDNAEITEEVYEFSEEGFASLEQFLSFLKEEEIENVLFVRFPRRNTITDGERYTEGVQMILKAGYDILDYCTDADDTKGVYTSDTFNTYNRHKETVNLNPNQDFYDAEHVNIFGAEKLTKDLAAYISTLLQVKHSDAKAAETWENAASFNTQVLMHAKQLTQAHAHKGLYTQRDFLKQP
ncbi:MAG: hypothetical protein IKZ95_01510 [Lachnospiraceae bacterium]|nr:hypothetical protein [Lachnospiraceae bacterium]